MKFLMDNMVVVIYVLKMGGKIELFNILIIFIWKFCMDRNIWFFVSYIVGVENMEVDFFFCYKNNDLEWILDIVVFDKIIEIYG